MKKKIVEPIDEQSAMIYPDPDEDEVRVEQVRKSILQSAGDAHYFPLEFRMRDIVIDSLARKYGHTIANYPFDPDSNEERFLIGARGCCRVFRSLNCPYMKKVAERLLDSGVNENNIIGIYLFDDSDDANRQKFLLLSKDGVYLRNDSNKIEYYLYGNLIFKFDGIARRPEVVVPQKEREGMTEAQLYGNAVKGVILEYPFDETFVKFAQEIMLLRLTTLLPAGDRHPFSDMKIPEFRNEYVEMLVDVAAAEGKLTVENMIRLEYIARELKINAADLETYFKSACNGGFKAKTLQKRLTDFLTTKWNVEDKFVIFQDILELAVGIDGEIIRKDMIGVLRRKAYAGADFVSNYIAFVQQKRIAEKSLAKALGTIDYISLSSRFANYLENIMRLQRYSREIDLTLLKIGVMANEQ